MLFIRQIPLTNQKPRYFSDKIGQRDEHISHSNASKFTKLFPITQLKTFLLRQRIVKL